MFVAEMGFITKNLFTNAILYVKTIRNDANEPVYVKAELRTKSEVVGLTTQDELMENATKRIYLENLFIDQEEEKETFPN